MYARAAVLCGSSKTLVAERGRGSALRTSRKQLPIQGQVRARKREIRPTNGGINFVQNSQAAMHPAQTQANFFGFDWLVSAKKSVSHGFDELLAKY